MYSISNRHERQPLIGVTPDIDFAKQGRPPRAFYSVDARNFDAIRHFDCLAVMLPHETDKVGQYIDTLDGVFITGGGYQFQDEDLFPDSGPGKEPPHKFARTRFECELARAALEKGVPFLGVCGGFQVLNRVLGGKLIVDLEQQRPGEIRHRQSGPYDQTSHRVNIQAGSILERLVPEQEYDVNSLHKQGVIDAGTAVVSARAPDGLVEAIEVAGHPFAVGIQWHPEFFLSEIDKAIFAAFAAASREYQASRRGA